MFKSQTQTKPIDIGIVGGDYVAVCFEPSDLNTFMKVLDSPATGEAMAFDGVKRETVKVFVLDKQFTL